MRVKLSIPGAPANMSLEEFGGDDNFFNDVYFAINDGSTEADLWFIFENPVAGDDICNVNPANVFWFSGETAYPMDFYKSRTSFLNQFAKLFTFYDIDLPTVVRQPPFLPWMINANHGYSSYSENGRGYDFFKYVAKFTKHFDLSVICSNKTFTPEHALRFEFVSKLKGVLGERLHWYGNGVNPISDKFGGITPYRYHLAIENKFQPDILSEKVFDPFLGLSFPIYAGATNLSDYFPTKSFVPIDITNFDEAFGIIVQTIDDDLYTKNYEPLLEAKRLVLDERNPFKRYAKIARDCYTQGQEELVSISRCEGTY